jgi:hypothetical protein
MDVYEIGRIAVVCFACHDDLLFTRIEKKRIIDLIARESSVFLSHEKLYGSMDFARHSWRWKAWFPCKIYLLKGHINGAYDSALVAISAITSFIFPPPQCRRKGRALL